MSLPDRKIKGTWSLDAWRKPAGLSRMPLAPHEFPRASPEFGEKDAKLRKEVRLASWFGPVRLLVELGCYFRTLPGRFPCAGSVPTGTRTWRSSRRHLERDVDPGCCVG